MVQIEVAVPPDDVAEVEALFELKGCGVFPEGALRYDPGDRCFLLQLDGKPATFLLELLRLGLDSRGAMSYVEWLEARSRQLELPELEFGSLVNRGQS
jgi:hypothetical protein